MQRSCTILKSEMEKRVYSSFFPFDEILFIKSVYHQVTTCTRNKPLQTKHRQILKLVTTEQVYFFGNRRITMSSRFSHQQGIGLQHYKPYRVLTQQLKKSDKSSSTKENTTYLTMDRRCDGSLANNQSCHRPKCTRASL